MDISLHSPLDDTRDSIALVAGVAMGAKVMTMEGELPVEYLSVGDRVLTRGGARRIRAITVMVAKSSEVVHVSAQSLGHDRPSADIILPATQKILIRDWRAKALFDSETAMVAVGRLADGAYIRQETASGIRFFALGFDADEVIYVNDLEIACAVQPALASV